MTDVATEPGSELEVRPDRLPEPSDVPVLEGEIVDEPRPLRKRWAEHPKVPLVFKPVELVPQAKPARRHLMTRAMRAPVVTAPKAVGRGGVFLARAWHRYVQVSEQREEARKKGVFAEKAKEIRDKSRQRWFWSFMLGLPTLLVLSLSVLFGWRTFLLAFFALLVTVCLVAGRKKDGSPGRKPTIGARKFGWTMDPEMLNDAYRDAGIIKKDDKLRTVKHAEFDGKGWHIVLDLPPTVKASSAIANVESLASALALDEICLSLERVRGDAGHAGRVSQWASPKDPFGGDKVPYPLILAERWDAWTPSPFGLDKRDRKVPLGLVWSNLLIGAKPGAGKTFTARVAVSPFVLDANVRVYCWNGKGDKAWRAISELAYRYGNGAMDEECERLRDTLAELKSEVIRRFNEMDTMSDEECPDGKLTPELSRDPQRNMGLIAVMIDELQNYTECGAEGWKQHGKKATVGQNIGSLLTWLAKNSRAAGVVLVLATQRPDALSLPTGLRSQMGHRFALKVMDWRDSNIILGEQMNTRGYDSSLLLGAHLGVGILRPDGELAGVDAGCPTVRVYWMSGAEWTELCERGRRLRLDAGTLAGHAAGQDMSADADAVRRAAEDAERERDDAIDVEFSDYPELPSPLREVVEYLADDLDEDGRSFVPTSELAEELEMTPAKLANDLRAEPICLTPNRNRMPGEREQVRGYRMANVRAAIERCSGGDGDAQVIELPR